MVEPIFVKTIGAGELIEVAYLRKAVKRHICGECKRLIPVGELYIEDNLNRIRHYSFGSKKIWFVHKVCQDCWKAPLQ